MSQTDKKQQTVYLLKGLPGSGKSTRAKEMMAQNSNLARVNKDDIRLMTALKAKDDKDRKPKRWESLAVEIERAAAREMLERGFDVVVDDTNLNPKHEEFFTQLARDHKAAFEIIDLLDVPIQECIRRDAKRPQSVGSSVIYGMAAHNGLVQTQNKKFECEGEYIICDIDGTLANIDHRLHYIKNINNDNEWRKDWNTFFDSCIHDEPRNEIVSLVKDSYKGYPVVLVTGRPESIRHLTVEWLNGWGIEYDALLMREAGDRRPDYIVKAEILANYLERDKVKVVIDDRPRVVTMWREANLDVINVGTGEDF